MRVLIACESSGVVRNAFRARGHDAWSCDLLPADDGHPCHIQGDALEAIANGLEGEKWDLVIGHPPCTHLSASGARWWPAKRADGRQQAGVIFFMSMIAACDEIGCRWAMENPIGIMSTVYRKPDCIIQPWQHGHGQVKATCLWLSGLPPLKPSNVVEGREAYCHRLPPSANRWKLRSATLPGIAAAMAEQWGGSI
jgi:site-specific DNA-cytosine methylase